MDTWKLILILLIIAVGFSIVVHGVKAEDNSTYYMNQGDTAYLNQYVDISGVIPPYQYIAYWDGYDMYEGNATYKIDVWQMTNSEYFNFYIDPAIFTTRTGRWYKYNGYYERAGNNLAFIVARAKPILQNTTNITYQNPKQVPIVLPTHPALPTQHISDYLIARGYNFSINVNLTANVWVFGAKDFIYDYRSQKNIVNITSEMASGLSAGDYKVLVQIPRNDTNDFMVQYNQNTSAIDWFDASTFNIRHWDTMGQSPENVLYQLQTIFPQTRDTFMMFKLTVQEPTITIDRIDVMNLLNDTRTGNDASLALQPASYVDVRGYTNLPPDIPILITVNPNFNITGDNAGDGSIGTLTEGTAGGDMRTFKAIVPIHLYNLPIGRNFIGAKIVGSKMITTADFYIYGSPDGHFTPNKTIRYVAGRYGPEEMVPTPTPITVEKIVTQVVTVTVTVPVTPSNEQVYAQQTIVAKDRETYWIGTIAVYCGGVVAAFFIGRFVFRAIKRRKWMKE